MESIEGVRERMTNFHSDPSLEFVLQRSPPTDAGTWNMQGNHLFPWETSSLDRPFLQKRHFSWSLLSASERRTRTFPGCDLHIVERIRIVVGKVARTH